MLTRTKRPKQLSMTANIYAHFMVDLRGNVSYQRGFIVNFNGFKVATSTFVLSILDKFMDRFKTSED